MLAQPSPAASSPRPKITAPRIGKNHSSLSCVMLLLLVQGCFQRQAGQLKTEFEHVRKNPLITGGKSTERFSVMTYFCSPVLKAKLSKNRLVQTWWQLLRYLLCHCINSLVGIKYFKIKRKVLFCGNSHCKHLWVAFFIKVKSEKYQSN